MKRNCIIGIGNTLRADDGLGIHICEEIRKLNLPQIRIYTAQQLQTEWLLDLDRYDRVLIVDAAVDEATMEIVPVQSSAVRTSNLSHHVNLNLLSGLMAVLHRSSTQFFTLAVPGENFDFGEQLSGTATANAKNAVKLIREWLAD